jgi:hypothetical protein
MLSAQQAKKRVDLSLAGGSIGAERSWLFEVRVK